MKRIALTLVTASLVWAPLVAQSPTERTAARDIAAKYGDAVVTVLGAVKVHMNMAGKEMPVPDNKLQANSVVLDRSGLTVMPLSTLDATDAASGILGSMAGAGMPKIEMTSEPADLRIRLSDGREVPAHVVLRDKDLDLAFLRPVDLPDKPWAALDGPSATAGVMDPVISLERFGEMANWKIAPMLGYVQLVLETPRTAYVVTTQGTAVFDTTGKFVGLAVIKHGKPAGSVSLFSQGGPSENGMMDALGMMRVVLPADDIRKVASQATSKQTAAQ